MIRVLCATAAISLASVAHAGERLDCGKTSGIKSEAEWKPVPSQNIYQVDLTFIGRKPPNPEIDKLLRECAALVIKRDPSKDILVSAWLRKRLGDNWRDDELLHPWGGLKFMSYEARSKTVAVRDLKLQKK